MLAHSDQVPTSPVAADAPLSGTRPGLLKRVRSLPLLPVLILIGVLAAGLCADVISPHDPTVGDLRLYLRPPAFVEGGDTRFLLGTDQLGRDVLSRIIYGARVSIIVVVLAIAFGGIFGLTLGLVAGHAGGWIDEVIMRLVDVQLALPTILVTLVLVTIFGSSFVLMILIIGFWLWPTSARLIRGEVRRIKTLDYVALARVAGASTARILFVHELPGVVNTMVVVATLQAGWVILLEGSLNFLGVGTPPPAPTWGSMIAEGRNFISTAWWLSFFPGIVMLLTVLALNLVGDWLRDALDPRRVVV